jgi:CRP/FNR family transcriptional regulator, cyclic AMP receptor protein
LYSTGDFFGHVAMLQGTVHKDTAEAMEESEVVIIPREAFEALVYNNREVARKFMQLLAHHVAETETHLLQMAYDSLRKKVANALLMLRNKYKTTTDTPFSIDLSRENLATIAGTATESLIRTLSDFKSENLLHIQDGRITLINETKLEQLLN